MPRLHSIIIFLFAPHKQAMYITSVCYSRRIITHQTITTNKHADIRINK